MKYKLEVRQTHPNLRITDIWTKEVRRGWQNTTVYSSDALSLDDHDNLVKLMAAAPELLKTLEKIAEAKHPEKYGEIFREMAQIAIEKLHES